jgi:hypothetical protein
MGGHMDIREFVNKEIASLNDEAAIGPLSDYGKGKQDGLGVAKIVVETLPDVEKQANAVMIYCWNCMNGGAPLQKSEIIKILKETK